MTPTRRKTAAVRMTLCLLPWVLGLASTCSPVHAQEAAAQTVVIGMAQEPDRLGTFAVMSAARVVEGAVFTFIAPYTDQWTRRPLLVEQLPTLQNGQWQLLAGGQMRVTWRIRRGFSWHDGHPVTALDFRFTFGVLRNPLVPGLSRIVTNKIDYALVPDARDPYTLVVQWKERYPFAGSLPFGEQIVMPRHLLETAYLRDPARLMAHPYWRAPVGNGPYRFLEWRPGSHIAVEAFPRFLLGRPGIPRLIFRFILDSTVLQAAVISGDVDVTEINNFGIEQMVEIERRAPAVAAFYTPSLRWERIGFNLDNDWLRDRRVRRALAHAIDREIIVRAVYEGRYQVAHTWLAPRHPAAHSRVRRYGYDPVRARQLLADADFAPGPDGILRDRDGRRVEMTLLTTAGHSAREQIAQIIKEQLRHVGVELRIDLRPASVLIGSIIRRREYPHMALWSTLFSLESTGYEGFHSSQIPGDANRWEGFNSMGWRNAENDRLLEAIVQELDEAKRHLLLRQQQAIFADDLPALPLYFVPALTTAKRTLRGVRPAGLFGSAVTWNVFEWAWGR